MSFQQGLSGLNAASKALEVIGNNVANANTAGFKQAQAQFADVYANSLAGAGTSQAGIGTRVAQIAQQFTQGNITSTSNPLDIAINGGGFFRLVEAGSVSYTRNGQFQLDKDGFIVNSSGARLTGYLPDASGSLNTGAPQELNINNADLPPRATAEVNTLLNLNSGAIAPSSPFDMEDAGTYNGTTSVSVFDSLGNPHVLRTFYVRDSGNPARWNVYAALGDQPINYNSNTSTHNAIGTLAFDSNGALDAATLAAMPFSLSSNVSTGASALAIDMDFTGTTQFGAGFGVNTLNQDGYASGRLSGFSVSSDGTIVGRYTNGKANTLGQVVLARFTNPNGLQPIGNNGWIETSTSGPALTDGPGAGGLGTLQSSTLEESNVDLTAELIKMITAQRNYQANAQTIKTQDQVMQTLVNLR